MANIRERQRGGKRVFQVQVRMAGFPARTATFPTRRLAERWATTTEAQMIEGKHFRTAEARRRMLADAIDRHTEEELPKKRAGDMHRHNLPWWRKHYGHIKLADLTPAIIVEARGKLSRQTYIRAKPDSKRTTLKPGEQPQAFQRSPKTVNRYLAVLRHVLTVARKEWQWMSHNPMDQVKMLPEGAGRVRYLSEEERGRLLAETAKDATLHCIVMLALSTASRAGELLRIEWRDVDLKEGRVLLTVSPS